MANRGVGLLAAVMLGLSWTLAAADEIVVVGGKGHHCGEDPGCFNRLHPAIPMIAVAKPGQTIVFNTRNATDLDLDPDSEWEDPRDPDDLFGAVHALTGPVHIEGAKAGDVLAVTLEDIEPGPFGFTLVLVPFGFASDANFEPMRVTWRLSRKEAVSDGLPGVRIPYAAFPGIVTVLPGPVELAAILKREQALADAGGSVNLPLPTLAEPAEVCGPEGTHRDECLRTIPPREHGGNFDIRYLSNGVTIYLPCQIDGCGLAVGDLHFAQGDGEVAGTAIEMDAKVTLTTRLINDGPKLKRGPHYEGPARLLNIPSGRFYATTGFPIKRAGEVPPDMVYLESAKVAELENLSMDISLAARNALLEMVDYISETYGYTREQAYIIASVAVDLRIGQLVDAPNVVVSAILPLDIFTGQE